MTTEITYKGSYQAWKSEHGKKLAEHANDAGLRYSSRGWTGQLNQWQDFVSRAEADLTEHRNYMDARSKEARKLWPSELEDVLSALAPYERGEKPSGSTTKTVAGRQVTEAELTANKERIVEEAEHRGRLQLEELGDDPDPKKLAAREVYLEALGELRGLSWDAVIKLGGRDYPIFDASALGAKKGGNAVVAYIQHVEPYKSELAEIMEAAS